MLIIPITEEERLHMERTLEATSTSRMMLNFISPLSSPRRSDAPSIELYNQYKQSVVDNLLENINDGEELHRKYNDVDKKAIKMGMVKK